MEIYEYIEMLEAIILLLLSALAIALFELRGYKEENKDLQGKLKQAKINKNKALTSQCLSKNELMQIKAYKEQLNRNEYRQKHLNQYRINKGE